MKRFRMIFIGIISMLIACNKPIDEQEQPSFDESTVTITKPSSAGDEYEVAISASDDIIWTAEAENGQDWLSIDIANGKGTGKVIFSLSENIGIETRLTQITVNAYSEKIQSFKASKTITVNQLGTAPAISIEAENTVSIEYIANTYDYNICSNVEWEAYLTNAPTWARIIEGTTGNGYGRVSIEIDENNTDAIRSVELVVSYSKDPQIKASITITQQFVGITYSIIIPGMSGFFEEGKSVITISDGNKQNIEAEIICTDGQTVINFKERLSEGRWNLSKVGTQEVDCNFEVDKGGNIAAVETWNEPFQCFGGDTEARPIKISSETDLITLVHCFSELELSYSGKYFLQTMDITLSTDNWPGIGTVSHKFDGIYDGGNHVIANLKITTNDTDNDDPEKGHGLFNHVRGRINAKASIKNLSVYGANDSAINANFGSVAGVVAHIADSSIVDNCHNYADINACSSFSANGGANVGGVIGWANGAQITVSNCSNNGAIDASGHNVLANNIGGVAGAFSGSDINNCAILDNCSNKGAITVRGNAGGIFGNCGGNATLKRLSNYGNVTSTGGNARMGGVGGSMTGEKTELSESFNNGTIVGLVNTGGLIGYIETGAAVRNCYNAGSVTVTGNNANNGGVVGHKKDTKSIIENSYNCGPMVGSDKKTNFGAICGSNLGTATDILQNITGCVYEIGKGAVKAIAKNVDTAVDESIASAKTTAEMTSGTTFNGWNTEIWSFKSGSYPLLISNPTIE